MKANRLSILFFTTALAFGDVSAGLTLEQVRTLNDQGRYREAESAARDLLERSEALEGPDSLAVAKTLDQLVQALRRGGKSTKPETKIFAERALGLKSALQGEDSAGFAASLYQMAMVQKACGQPALALETHRRALRIRELVLKPDHPDIAMSLLFTGQMTWRQEGDFEPVARMYDRAHEIYLRQEDDFERDRGVAFVLRMKADFYALRAEVEQALALHRESLEIRLEVLGPDHPQVGMNYNNIGDISKMAGRYDEAATALEEAVRIWEKSLGPDHPKLAIALTGWAELFWFGEVDLETARFALERALGIQERVLGPDHPELGETLEYLGGLLKYEGDNTAARPLYERAMANREGAGGPNDFEVAASLENIALLDLDIGDPTRALPILERALGLFQMHLGADHVKLAGPLGMIGRIHLADGDLSSAETVLEKAVSILRDQPDGDAAVRADAFHALATLRVRQIRYDDANRLDREAIALRERAFGADHELVAESLRKTAETLQSQGRDAEARILLQRALAILEKTYGSSHYNSAVARYDLARIAFRTGDTAFAFASALESETASREYLRLALRGLSERQALGFAASRNSGIDLALSILVDGTEEKGATRNAWDAVVRARALVLDEMASRRRSVGNAGDKELSRLFEDLGSSRSRLAYFALNPPENMKSTMYRDTLDKIQKEKELLEIELGRRSALFGKEIKRRTIGLEDVSRELPGDAALVAFIRYRRHTSDPAHPVYSYAAFVYSTADAEPVLVPIGEAGEIDRLLLAFRDEIAKRPVPKLFGASSGSDLGRATGNALRQRVWDRLMPHLADAPQVFIVPDGALHELNFAALPVEQGFLVEQGPTIHYLSAERDLVRGDSVPRATTLLALGAPDFDRFPETKPDGAGVTVAHRGPDTDCANVASMHFDPIPEARLELQKIASLWSTDTGREPVETLLDAAASESGFKRMAPGRGALHIATHGFFSAPDCGSGTNPLLLSGLALAGANRHEERGVNEEDGILTAEEVAALDLSSVGWAVLSACDTGRGEIVGGEGVFGLRRAFEIAGVDTLILSLWKVDDAAARAWMLALYRHRQAGSSTTEAVRQASLEIIAERREAGLTVHPYYWAGFVATGDWR